MNYPNGYWLQDRKTKKTSFGKIAFSKCEYHFETDFEREMRENSRKKFDKPKRAWYSWIIKWFE